METFAATSKLYIPTYLPVTVTNPFDQPATFKLHFTETKPPYDSPKVANPRDGGVYFGPGDARNNLGGLHWDGVWAVQEEEGAPWTPRLIDDFSSQYIKATVGACEKIYYTGIDDSIAVVKLWPKLVRELFRVAAEMAPSIVRAASCLAFGELPDNRALLNLNLCK